MSIKQQMSTVALKLGSVQLNGLIRMTGVLPKGVASDAKDVVGFDYIVQDENGNCHSYYAANPPLIGMTEPVPVPHPLGIESFDDYKVDYKQAISIFHTGNWGSYFCAITLSKPLVFPPAKEPYWYIRSTLQVDVIIGANTGDVYRPK
jgi:hypothetical protein